MPLESKSLTNDADTPPLKGLRVLELGQYIAAPAAGQALADMGADVIKLEPPTGDASRRVGWAKDDFGPMFSAYNRGKRSVVLDLRHATGRARALQLADSVDVVLANARPGAMERQGLGAEALMARNERLIYGRVSAFGQEGPASIRPGFDIAAQAESGMMSLNGEAGRDPVRVGFTVVDLLASQMLTSGVLAALFRRSTSGRGGLVDLSLIDVAITALANAWTEYGLTGQMPLRRGNGQASTAPAADVIPTQDGMVVLSAYMDDHFQRLCATIERPDLAQDQRFATNANRVAHRHELNGALSESLSHFKSDVLVDLLAQGGIVAGAIRTMDGVRAGRGGVSADLFVKVQAPGRDAIGVPGLPMSLSGIRRTDGLLARLGQHTDEVLAQLDDARGGNLHCQL